MPQLFFVPVLRHFWHWLGVRPAHRKVMEKILSSGTSVVLCPGGVQECLVMEQNAEVVYLKNRRGFVRMAIQQGAGEQAFPSCCERPVIITFYATRSQRYTDWVLVSTDLLPAFAFGQR